MGVLGELNNTTPVSKGKSKSKTPLKSPAPAPVGLLTPNNDKREKERNKAEQWDVALKMLQEHEAQSGAAVATMVSL